MKFIIYVKNLLGISSNDPMVWYVLSNLILSVIAFLSFINIFIYFFIIYILDRNIIVKEKINK